MTVHIDFAKARDLLGQVVAERGDAFVYQATCEEHCTYWNTLTDSPDCGVGCVLSKAGVPNSIIAQLDGQAVASFSTLYAQGFLGRLGVDVTFEAMSYLQAFQGRQDAGWTWGEARQYAESGAVGTGMVVAK